MAGKKGVIILGSILAFAVILAVAYAIPGSPVKDWLTSVILGLQGMNPVAQAVLFTSVQTLAVMLILPGTPFNLAAGALFGLLWGSVISVVAIDLSSIISFLIARYLARNWAEDQMRRRPKFQAVDIAVEDKGWYIVFLVRLAPVFPYGLCSYLFGVTKIGFVGYISATTAGTIPGTVAYTYIGTLASNLPELLSGEYDYSKNWSSVVLLFVAVIATLATIILVTLVTRRALATALAKSELEQSADTAADSTVGELLQIDSGSDSASRTATVSPVQSPPPALRPYLSNKGGD